MEISEIWAKVGICCGYNTVTHKKQYAWKMKREQHIFSLQNINIDTEAGDVNGEKCCWHQQLQFSRSTPLYSNKFDTEIFIWTKSYQGTLPLAKQVLSGFTPRTVACSYTWAWQSIRPEKKIVFFKQQTGALLTVCWPKLSVWGFLLSYVTALWSIYSLKKWVCSFLAFLLKMLQHSSSSIDCAVSF